MIARGPPNKPARSRIDSGLTDIIPPCVGCVAVKHIPIVIDRGQTADRRWIGVGVTTTFDDILYLVMHHVSSFWAQSWISLRRQVRETKFEYHTTSYIAATGGTLHG